MKDEIGVSPKALSRLARFERAVRLLRRPDRPSLGEVALAAGFYDQAHLTNEVRQMSGRTPREHAVSSKNLATEPG